MLPLAGVVVVAVEQAVAAPLCTRHLADLGARVIKVEHVDGGDFARSYDTAVNGLASHFVWLNRNKESMAVDLKHPDGAALLRRLVARADVVVQNLAPGAATRIGLDPEELVARHPRLVVADISGYGRGGPLDHKRAYDLLAQAEAGSCAITGWPGAPAKPGIPVADVGAGLYALSGVLAALHARERTGAGGVVAVSLFDTVAELMGFALNWTRHTGQEWQASGMGSPLVAPYGAYPTSDGHTVVLGTTNDREWQRFATDLLGRPDLAADPRFARGDGRVSERATLDEVVGAWCRERSCAEVQARADAAGIGNARVNTVADVVEHPQLLERDRWRQVDSEVGPVPALVPPATSREWDVRMDPVPALGEHTSSVLAELGYDDAEATRLRDLGVV